MLRAVVSSSRLGLVRCPKLKANVQATRQLSLFGWAKSQDRERTQLFHPLSRSPIPALRARADAVTALAPCPVCLDTHHQHRPAQAECPDCGWPTHCSQLHWSEDPEHKKYCSRLREVNEDEHDLRSGRRMTEFELPGPQSFDEVVSFANWDVFWYTRGFASIDSERSRRHASKLLTYPMTVASVLHENSGLTLGNQRVTPSGMRSLAALRSTLHRPPGKNEVAESRPPVRLFLLGARAESSLPSHVWEQLSFLFPRTAFHIFMIGPQVSLPASSDDSAQRSTTKGVYEPPIYKAALDGSRTRDERVQYGVPSSTIVVSPTMTITLLRASYNEVHEHFGTLDPYTDAFFAFCPGFGFPSPTSPSHAQISSPTEWGPVMPLLLESKCALFVTGFSPADVERDVRSLDKVEGVSGEFDWVITPGANPFGSDKWEVADFDPRVMVKTNWGIWAIRGKLRELQTN